MYILLYAQANLIDWPPAYKDCVRIALEWKKLFLLTMIEDFVQMHISHLVLHSFSMITADIAHKVE